MGMKETLDKLIENAMMPNNEIAVRDLLETMDKIEIGVLKEAAPAFDQLCVSWEEEITKSDDKANICVHIGKGLNRKSVANHKSRIKAYAKLTDNINGILFFSLTHILLKLQRTAFTDCT